MIETHGHSVLVEYERDRLSYRSYVDVLDVQDDDKCPAERLKDAPASADWAGLLQLDGIPEQIHSYLTTHGIWTRDDLRKQDRVVIRLATDTLGRAIWDAAKRSCKG